MIIQAQPNRDDYEHALAAHGVWAGPKYRRRGARQQFLRWIWSVVFGSLLILAVIPEILPAADWALAPGVVIAMVVVYPLAILALALHIRSLIGSASAPLSIGIVEQGMLPKSSVSHFAKQRGLIGWIIFAFLTAALFAMMTWQSTSPIAPVSGRKTPAFLATSANADEPVHAVRIPGTALVVGSALASLAALVLLGKMERAAQAKSLLESQPSLLFHRTWEFNEEDLTESGPVLKSIMKWEYLRKFLETPRVIMLYASDRSFYLVPKTAFIDELQLSEFLGLLMRKVPNGIIQARPTRGFAVLPIAAFPIQPPPLPPVSPS